MNITVSIFQELFSGDNQHGIFNIHISIFYLFIIFLGMLWGQEKEIYYQFAGEEHKNLDQRIP